MSSPRTSRSCAGGAPYSMVVGLLFLVLIVIAGINAVSNQGVSIEGLSNWEPLPRFAAPAATGSLDGDANVNQDDTSASGKPRTPACAVPEPHGT